MPINPWLRPVLADEGLTRGLGDAEARVLVEWLADWADRLVSAVPDDAARRSRFDYLHRRARALARFVCWWGDERHRPAAVQLAAVERFGWPLPPPEVDPCDLMQQLVAWEDGAAAA
jgi:hypothetical protein